MEALLRNLTNLSIDCSQDFISIEINPVMVGRHTCLCCFNILRHLRLKRLYWHCSHYNQEMPVYKTQPEQLEIDMMMLATLVLLHYSHQIKIVRERCKETFVFLRRALVKLACDRIRGY